jgi:glutathione peroxidase-family protein
MRKLLTKQTLRLAVLPVAVCSSAAIAHDPPATAPSTLPTNAAQRSVEAILDDYQRVNAEVRALVRSPDELLDPARRAAIAEQAVPQLKKLLVLADELSTAGAAGRQFSPQLRSGVDSVLAVFDDPEAIGRLTQLSKTDDPAVASQARCALLFGSWVRSNSDAAVQTKLLDDVESLAKSSPADDNLAILLLQMSEAAPATPDIRARARTIANTSLTGEMAQQIKQQTEADAKLAGLVGQPLNISGTRHNGETFNSDDWKGKVVLVDFAVSAWPPSRENSDRLAKVYSEYHSKGLEIVTISCDESIDDLKKFLNDNPNITWPHLYDAQNPGWHPLAKQLHVTDPSTAILINRDGIVVSVTAREGLEQQIAKLLNP